MLRPDPRPSSPPDQPRRHDADDAGVPVVGGEHQGPVLGVQRAAGQLDRLVEDALVQGLAAGVQRLELARHPGRFVGVVGQQQAQTVVRVADASGGVEPRGENESHVPRPQRLPREARRLDQSAEAGPARVGEHLEPVTDQDAVLPRERHDVGDGGERDVIEKVERQVLRQRKGLNQRLGELERDAGPAQVLVGGWAIGAARVQDRARRRQLVAGKVVIGDDHVDARRPCGADGRDGGDAAVARDDEASAQPLGGGEPGGPEVVAIPETVGDERLHRGSGGAQYARQHRRGALAVDIVVAVHKDRVAGAHRARHEIQRDPHVCPRQAVTQAGQIRPQERLGGRGRGVAALHQQCRERQGDVQLRGQRLRRVGIGRRGDGPARGDHSAAYSSTPQASQPSMEAPRWMRTRRWVGTAVKQCPQASPCSAYSASGALPRRMRS